MGFTMGQYLRRTNWHFTKYGFLFRFYGLIGKIFKSKKYLDKSAYYLDKRWDIMMALLKGHK